MQNILRDKLSLDAQLLLLRKRTRQLERELQEVRAQSDAKQERVWSGLRSRCDLVDWVPVFAVVP